MTAEEFCKKWCYNNHDPATCPKLADLRQMLADERERAARIARSHPGCQHECTGCCAQAAVDIAAEIQRTP